MPYRIFFLFDPVYQLPAPDQCRFLATVVVRLADQSTWNIAAASQYPGQNAFWRPALFRAKLNSGGT
jgi:hypothetical protein